MKLLMATMGLGIGGAETHIVELCKELRRQGHDIAVCSNGGVYVPELQAVGVRHYNVPMHLRQLGSMKLSSQLLREAILKEQPDVVHAHARIPAFLCGSLQKSMHFPFVTTAHWVFNAKGLLRYTTNWGDRVIAVSHDIKDYLIQEYGYPAPRISTTINGIDTEKFSPDLSPAPIFEEFSLDHSHPILSYVSRMDEDRALVARQLISLAPQLDARFPGIQLLIAGGGNVLDQLTQEAQRQNEALGRPCITMAGGRTDINCIVAAGDLFIGVSRAALEAMAGGKPVIVAGNEGYHGIFSQDKLEEAMAGNFCCRGLPLSTAEALLEDVSTLLSLSQEERRALGDYGRTVISQHYSVGRMADDCVAMYQKVFPRPARILLSGYYGFANAGDDAILQAIHQEVEGGRTDLDITVLSENPAQTERDYALAALPRFRLWTVISALRHCDILLSGGGSLLQDRTSTRSLLYYLAVIWGAKCFKKPVMLYANGIGPVTRPRNRRLVRKAVEGATLVTLRDQSSCDELREMGVTRPDLYVTADPVFRLNPAPAAVAEQLLAEASIPENAPFVAVSVRSWMETDGFVEGLAQLCDHLHTVHGLEVLFLLMQPSHDRAMSQAVISAMSAPAHLLDGQVPPEQLMAVLGKAKLTLAMRLHTLIFSARVGVPMLGLNYDPKVQSYLQELGMPSAGDVSAFDAPAAIAVADDLMSHYDGARKQLSIRSQALAQAAEQNQILLRTLLKKN